MDVLQSPTPLFRCRLKYPIYIDFPNWENVSPLSVFFSKDVEAFYLKIQIFELYMKRHEEVGKKKKLEEEKRQRSDKKHEEEKLREIQLQGKPENVMKPEKL